MMMIIIIIVIILIIIITTSNPDIPRRGDLNSQTSLLCCTETCSFGYFVKGKPVVVGEFVSCLYSY